MTIVTLGQQPLVLCETCYRAVGAAAAVVYPARNGHSHFPMIRSYCGQDCLERGERGQPGPTVTVGWETFLKDLSRVG